MKAHITRYSVCIPLTKDQWEKLRHIEDTSRPGCFDRYDRFIDNLKKSGAEGVEFNGHFGRNILFDVAKESHIPRVVRKLERILEC